MKVALTYNLKPALPPTESVSSISNKVEKQFDDLYAEWDTVETIEAVKHAIEKKYSVVMIEADLNAFENIKKHKPDIVFNIAEGMFGASREAQIPAMLDMLQTPYLGSDPLTLCLCLDKARTKEILTYHKIRTPRFILADDANLSFNGFLKYPVIVKPSLEGSSKGIFNSSVAFNEKDMKTTAEFIKNNYNQRIIIEEFLEGREFTVAIMGNGKQARALPIVEINFSELPDSMNKIYSYEAKWILDNKDNPLEIFQCPANVNKELKEKIIFTALEAYKALNCKDWSRIDIRLDAQGEPNIIEINPLPGILPNPDDNSCFPKAARAAGMNYDQLILTALEIAAKRHGLL